MKMRPAPPTTRGFIRALGVISLLAIVSAPPVAAAEPPKFNPPKTYYLALGDSFAYGFTNAKFLAGRPPSAFDTGFVDVFAQQLRTIQPSIRVVNYSCVGESTRTFITGPCLGNTLGIGLHDEWSGTQLDAALTFLSTHKGEVSPITITLWANDVRELAESCSQDFACILEGAPATITRVATNLKTILTRLRVAAPQAEIIVTGPWNSAIGTFPIKDPIYLQLESAMKRVAVDTMVRFAELFPRFNPQGDVDAEAAAICALTLVCVDGDIHLSDAGNRVVADGVWEASGYQRLIP
jgi:lysophospholipase L1-like esterase